MLTRSKAREHTLAEPRTMLAQKTALAHQFDDLAQQYEASSLGMWAFLLTELMFFGGLFVGYTVYRTAYLAGFIAGSQHLKVLLQIGSVQPRHVGLSAHRADVLRRSVRGLYSVSHGLSGGIHCR